MPRYILLILTPLFIFIDLLAQPGQMRGRAAFEQVEAEKIAFFTSYLELTSQEAKEFWPVYNDYQSRRNLIARERQNTSTYFLQNINNLSGKEAEEISDKYIDLQIRESELAREFHDKFKAVLPPEKVMRFYQAENEFRMQLLRRLRGAGQGRGPGGQNW